MRAGRLDGDAVARRAGRGRPPRPAARAATRPAGLSEREVEVLRLLARGLLRTGEIAQQLGISERTVDHHIQHIYAKIGVSTRAAATLFAMQHGLILVTPPPRPPPPAGARRGGGLVNHR